MTEATRDQFPDPTPSHSQVSVGALAVSGNSRHGQQQKPLVSIVIPVMNEADNIMPLVSRLKSALEKTAAEVIFVDDSKDDLSVEATGMAAKLFGGHSFDVCIIHRHGKKRRGGLSGAVTDGMQAAHSKQIIVMDGDLQHPPETIPDIMAAAHDKDIVIASRYRRGGSAKGLDGGIRHLVSRGSTLIAKLIFPLRLKGVTDPMTGFFLINYDKIKRGRMNPKGFKILLEILATHPKLRKTEVPLQFAERAAGESHGDLKQGLIFFGQLLGLRFGNIFKYYRSLPKTVQFGLIGGSVFLIGMAVLALLVEVAGIPLLLANGFQLALTFWLNYVLNRRITWREREVNQRAALKFLLSRSLTTALNYALFAWLVSLQLSFAIAGRDLHFKIHYLAANVITLLVITALNFVATDRWAFAEAATKPSQPVNEERAEKNLRTAIFLGILAACLGTYLGVVWWSPSVGLSVILAITSFLLFVQASIEVWRMLYSYRAPESVDRLRFPAPNEEINERFCIIVPARHESETLAQTLLLLARQTYTELTIYSVICDDDMETLHVADTVAAKEDRVRVISYPLKPGTKPSKPLQLNYVLEQIEKEHFTVVGVFDAEDTVHPELLAHIAAAFCDPELDIVQAGVQLMNHDSSWYSLHNVMEYYRWFNSAMAYNADNDFMPLGGNTVFIRSKLLHDAGGWPLTLTEDCALGVLLSTKYQTKTAVFYDPRLATQEETPGSLAGLFKQRVRWNQGFFHEWRKGTWRDLPSFRQRMFASYVLLSALLLAVISIFMIVSLLTIVLLKAPVILVMFMYLPFIPVGLMTFLNAVFLYDFGKAFNRKVTVRHYATLLLTQILYQVVLNAAALYAVIRELRGDTTWYKTPHSGLHRTHGAAVMDALQPNYAFAYAGDNQPAAQTMNSGSDMLGTTLIDNQRAENI